jgi:hypothetical protein
MSYCSLFYLFKPYMNYDFQIISCAGILLACKSENMSSRLSEICRIYDKLKTKNVPIQSFTKPETEIQKLKTNITQAEVQLLKVLNFNYGSENPFNYIQAYSSILYPADEEEIMHYAKKICCDSFYTYASLVYQPYVVALASIIYSASCLRLKSVRDDDFSFDKMKFLFNPPLNEKEFNLELMNYDDKLRRERSEKIKEESSSYFDCLEWYKKLHQFLELEDLLCCMDMINDFFEDMKVRSKVGNK